jgi:Domain of unknown function (DUF4386)
MGGGEAMMRVLERVGGVVQTQAAMSPRVLARWAAVTEMLEGVTSSQGQVFIPGGIVVADNAAATAANILEREQLFRVSVTLGMLAVGFHLAWTVLFYYLFRVVNRKVALFALVVSLLGIAVQAASLAFQLTPLILLDNPGVFNAFNQEQLQALALLFLRVRGQVMNMYLAFFGFWCVVTGYLIFRSTFMPRIIGALEAVAGIGYLTYLWPPLANALFPFNLAAGVGELVLQLWLLIFAVNAKRWHEKLQAAET